jgi:Carboxypeptidase regulatory-like domain
VIRTCRLVLAFAIAAGAAAIAQQPTRDHAAGASGTASIAGTVFEAGDRKRPARRVRVTLNNVERTSPGQTTTTDDSGAFSFRGLPAGRFELQAFKPAWLRASYGAARPDRAGTPVVVKDGEAVTNLTMTIVRGGVITGAVLDTRGRPVPGMSVRVVRLAYNGMTGERTLVTPGGKNVSALTDDRGESAPTDCRRVPTSCWSRRLHPTAGLTGRSGN